MFYSDLSPCSPCLSWLIHSGVKCNGLCHTSIVGRRGAGCVADRAASHHAAGGAAAEVSGAAVRAAAADGESASAAAAAIAAVGAAVRDHRAAGVCLARPTLRGSGAAGKEGAPVATALVFDNSLRMQYEQDNQTRLAKAKELGRWLLNQLPADSPVTIVDRRAGSAGRI